MDGAISGIAFSCGMGWGRDKKDLENRIQNEMQRLLANPVPSMSLAWSLILILYLHFTTTEKQFCADIFIILTRDANVQVQSSMKPDSEKGLTNRFNSGFSW